MRTNKKSLASKLLLAASLSLASCYAQEVKQSSTELPDAPSALVGNTIADFSLSLADATYSIKTNKLPGIYETDPIFGGKHPSTTRFYLTSLGLTSLASVASVELYRHHKKYWFVPQLIDEVVHFTGIIKTHSSVEQSNRFCSTNKTYPGC